MTIKYQYVPLDYCRFEVTGVNKSTVLSSKYLEFNSTYSRTTGEDMGRHVANLRNMQVNVYDSSRITLSGSLHQFAQEGRNYRNFTYPEFAQVLNEFREKIGVSPKHLRFVKAEYGINVPVPISAEDIVNRVMYYHGQFPDTETAKDKDYCRFRLSDYDFKIYNKGKQNKLAKELLRIEIREKDWYEMRKRYRLVSLQDFVDGNKNGLAEKLLKAWDSTVFCDPTIVSVGAEHHYASREYWRAVKASKDPSTFSYHRAQLKKLGREQGDGIQDLITSAIRDELQWLSSTVLEV